MSHSTHDCGTVPRTPVTGMEGKGLEGIGMEIVDGSQVQIVKAVEGQRFDGLDL